MLRWDISGVDNIYNKVKETVKKISKIFNLGNEWIEIVEDLPKYEPFLSTNVRYREHFIHEFQVFQLGYAIINKNEIVNEKLKKYLKTNEDDVIKYWFLGSMSHDSAYVIEGTPTSLQELLNKAFRGEVSCTFQIDPSRVQGYEFHKSKLIDLIGEKLELTDEQTTELYGKLSDILSDKRNHGLLSAIMLLKQLIKPRGRGKKEYLYEVALAIALHPEDVYKELGSLTGKSLTFEKLPFAFLLMFCDNAQEWGRPFMTSIFNQKVNDQKIKVVLDKLDIKQDKVEVVLQYSEEIDCIPAPDEHWGVKDIDFRIFHASNKRVFKKNIFIEPS